MSFRWQRNLDGWCLNLQERIDLYRKITKFHHLYKKCHKIISFHPFKQCENPVVNKPNRFYCAEHQREIWKNIKTFADPDILEILLQIEEES